MLTDLCVGMTAAMAFFLFAHLPGRQIGLFSDFVGELLVRLGLAVIVFIVAGTLSKPLLTNPLFQAIRDPVNSWLAAAGLIGLFCISTVVMCSVS